MQRCTDITLILDRSGSMMSIKNAMQEAMNGFLEDRKQVTKFSNEPCKFSLIQFDDTYETLYTAIDICNIAAVTIHPRGSTALLDAIGMTIQQTGDRLQSMPEHLRPDNVLIIIITDGMENSSRMFTRAKVFEMIKLQREVYKWDFIYMGANQDAIQEATSYGISSGNAINFCSTPRSARAGGQSLNSAVREYESAKKNFVSTENLFKGKLNVEDEELAKSLDLVLEESSKPTTTS